MLNVDLSIRAADGQGVVALSGEFDLADAPAVTSHLIAAVAACGPSVIVDLAALESIGFAGLQVLLRIRTWCRNSGGDLPLAAPQPPLRQVLEATGLIDVFAIYRSVDEAARGARGAQPPVPPAPLAVPPPARPATVPQPERRQPAHRRFYRPPASRASCFFRELTTPCSQLHDYILKLPQTSAYLSALDLGILRSYVNRGCHGSTFFRNSSGFSPGNIRRFRASACRRAGACRRPGA